jgi:hypothetical protein
MGFSYFNYSVQNYFDGVIPPHRVTTSLASFNHVACTHHPSYSDLPIRAMQRFIASGVVGVVLRGCISFNPLYREYSEYTPKLFPHSNLDPYQEYKWARQTEFNQYRQYLKWLVALINEFTIIEYVELFNEYLFKGANYIPFNRLLLQFILTEWHALRPMIRSGVLVGMSEPFIGAIEPEKHVAKVAAWRRTCQLDYTGFQLHQRKDILALPQLGSYAITENYTGIQVNNKNIIYHGY